MSSGDGSRRSSLRPDSMRCHARGVAPWAPVLLLIFAIVRPAHPLPTLSLPLCFPPPPCGEGLERVCGGKVGRGAPRRTRLPVTAFLAYFAGERPSIFAISSSRLSGGGSV